ncbi:hypothetical protein J6590_043309 [Homalodisca vitripennis]|nr:hypothetical protein J6590_043309 [Homalodisca vitripennis]
MTIGYIIIIQTDPLLKEVYWRYTQYGRTAEHRAATSQASTGDMIPPEQFAKNIVEFKKLVLQRGLSHQEFMLKLKESIEDGICNLSSAGGQDIECQARHVNSCGQSPYFDPDSIVKADSHFQMENQAFSELAYWFEVNGLKLIQGKTRLLNFPTAQLKEANKNKKEVYKVETLDSTINEEGGGRGGNSSVSAMLVRLTIPGSDTSLGL